MKKLHRVQIDIDIEAESHQQAVVKVMEWFCPQSTLHCHSALVLEEQEHVCPTCTPHLLEDGGYTAYQEYYGFDPNRKRKPESQSSECKGTGNNNE